MCWAWMQVRQEVRSAVAQEVAAVKVARGTYGTALTWHIGTVGLSGSHGVSGIDCYSQSGANACTHQCYKGKDDSRVGPTGER